MTDDKDNGVVHSSFAVAIQPEFKEGKWTGEVSAHIEEEVYDDLDADELTQIRSVCGMMASTLHLMEQDPDFLEYVKGYFASAFEEMIEEIIDDAEERKPQLFTRSEDGKVITLNFATKTFGSA